MARKRGPTDRIEKIMRKKKRFLPETSSTSQSNSSHLNGHLLSLYAQNTPTVNKLSTPHKEMESSRSEQIENENVNRIQNLDDSKLPDKILKRSERKKKFVLQPENSTISLNDVGGQDEVIAEILEIIVHLYDPELSLELRDRPENRIFLHGPPGSGKTHIVRAIAGELMLPYFQVRATELVGGVSGEAKSKIQDMFDEAIKCAPCILVIKELDAICPKREATDKSMETHMVETLSNCLNDLKIKDSSSKLKVFAVTNKPDSINQTLRGLFETEIAIEMPNEDARLKILQVLCKNAKLSPDLDLKWVAHHTPGYVAADLQALFYKATKVGRWRMYKKLINALHAKTKVNDTPNDNVLLPADEIDSSSQPKPNAIVAWCKSKDKIFESNRANICYKLEDFQAALEKYIPYSKREGFGSVPDVTWDGIGALDRVKHQLQRSIMWPLKYRKKFEGSGMSGIKGILLYGPKGCGKTLLAKALANECSINFLSVKGPELLSKYLGESEKQLRECFERAKYSAPCIIFFDEIDSLGSSRADSNVNPAIEKVVNQFLTLMDGYEDRKEVIVIGATNRIDKIDSAMMRPGRLEKVIFVDVPSPAERVEILKTLTKNKTEPRISENISLEEIAFDSRCENFSGADLSYLLREAFMNAVEECLYLPDSSPTIVQKEHFDLAFNVVKSSVTDEDKKYFKRCLKGRNMPIQ